MSTRAAVFHARLTGEGRMYNPSHDGSWPLDAEHYSLVADVEIPDGATDAEACEYAYDRTNTVHRAWWTHEGVTLCGPKTRSTSVGDIVVLDSGAFRVEGAGWSKVAT